MKPTRPAQRLLGGKVESIWTHGTRMGKDKMIIRKDQAPVVHTDEEDERNYGPSEWLHLSDESGLAQFGAHVHTLQPGSRSSERHWHEEEFLYLVSGEATVIEDDGPHTLRPGNAACWPAGVANAHQVVNRSGMPCSYHIVGSRAIPDIVHYPDRGDVLYAFEEGSWRLQRTDGTLIKEGTPDLGGKRTAKFRELRKAEVQLRRRPTSGSSATEGPPLPRAPYALLTLSHRGSGRPGLHRICSSRS